MRNDTCIFALSIDPWELKRKLLSSLYNCYSSNDIKGWNLKVVCQDYDTDTFNKLCEDYPDIEFIKHEKLSGPISHIRKVITEEVGVLKDYKYVIFIDDDFKYGPMAFEQYDHLFEEMDNHPEVGFVACHRRMKKENRLKISDIEFPYPHDLGVISMRTGLIVRSEAVPKSGLFHDEIAYHEEMYMALQVYLNGYEVGKAWMDIFHQSNKAGLGCKLQKEFNISKSNEAISSKRVAHELGLFEIGDNDIYYGGQDVGYLSSKAIEIHNNNKRGRFNE